MKTILLHQQFVDDLLKNDDAFFAKRMLGHIFSECDGSSNRKNDHRYHGVDNAWIRYVSRGKTAYRIIYIMKDGELVFYRCGAHSIEDRIESPNIDDKSLIEVDVKEGEIETMTKPLSILGNHRPPYIYSALLGRRLIPNKSVYLISPYIDPAILTRGSRIGQTLDSISSDGAEVIVISSAEQVGSYAGLHKDLSARNIELVFVPRLHSKIYLFITDTTRRHETATTPSLGIIGSSNLTARGVPATPDEGNLETNYTVASSSISDLEGVVMEYYYKAKDYRTTLKLASKPSRVTR